MVSGCKYVQNKIFRVKLRQSQNLNFPILPRNLSFFFGFLAHTETFSGDEGRPSGGPLSRVQFLPSSCSLALVLYETDRPLGNSLDCLAPGEGRDYGQTLKRVGSFKVLSQSCVELRNSVISTTGHSTDYDGVN